MDVRSEHETSREQVYEELRPLLFSIAYGIVGSVSEAEDLVQEAFLRFIGHSARGGHRLTPGLAVHGHHQAGDQPGALGPRAAGDLCGHLAAGAAADRPGSGRRSARGDGRLAVDGAAGAAGRA
jgi:hypothetical protein